VTPLLEAPVANRRNWTLACLIGDIEDREGVSISKSRLSKVLRKKVSLAPSATHPEAQFGRTSEKTTVGSRASGEGRC
jgi:hypothetical protein